MYTSWTLGIFLSHFWTVSSRWKKMFCFCRASTRLPGMVRVFVKKFTHYPRAESSSVFISYSYSLCFVSLLLISRGLPVASLLLVLPLLLLLLPPRPPPLVLGRNCEEPSLSILAQSLFSICMHAGLWLTHKINFAACVGVKIPRRTFISPSNSGYIIAFGWKEKIIIKKSAYKQTKTKTTPPHTKYQ